MRTQSPDDLKGARLEARILIVDDEAANVRLLERMLRQAGYSEVQSIMDPRAVLPLVDETPPDLILLDLLMPHMDGYTLISEIRARFPESVELPILVISADITPEAKHRSLLAGASDFLTKPFDQTEVFLRAANLLQTRQLHLRLLDRKEDLESVVAAQTKELRARLDELGRVDEQRRQLLSHLVHAEEDERRTIAADIHDDPIQKLTAASMRLDMVAEDHPELAGDEQFHKARDAVGRSIESLRSLMFELRPYVLDRDGLAAALSVFVQAEEKTPGCASYVVDNRLRTEPPESIRAILYRIAQEALVNVRKHSRATHVGIVLEEGDGGYVVRVKDDGVGFDPSVRTDPSLGHIGLTSMRERASLASGWFRIDSKTGDGTLAEVWIPASVDDAVA